MLWRQYYYDIVLIQHYPRTNSNCHLSCPNYYYLSTLGDMTVIWQLPESVYMDRENRDLCIGLIRYYAVLYCTVLYCTAALYCTILFCAVLYSSILYSSYFHDTSISDHSLIPLQVRISLEFSLCRGETIRTAVLFHDKVERHIR